mmetsp:Transcript_10380/g.26119  ORF Transcript_10380/g.26119 Transcript_10380/m.26119 type:complete len:289 (-) Transcript_10380:355-1221(-)
MPVPWSLSECTTLLVARSYRQTCPSSEDEASKSPRILTPYTGPLCTPKWVTFTGVPFSQCLACSVRSRNNTRQSRAGPKFEFEFKPEPPLASAPPAANSLAPPARRVHRSPNVCMHLACHVSWLEAARAKAAHAAAAAHAAFASRCEKTSWIKSSSSFSSNPPSASTPPVSVGNPAPAPASLLATAFFKDAVCSVSACSNFSASDVCHPCHAVACFFASASASTPDALAVFASPSTISSACRNVSAASCDRPSCSSATPLRLCPLTYSLSRRSEAQASLRAASARPHP